MKRGGGEGGDNTYQNQTRDNQAMGIQRSNAECRVRLTDPVQIYQHENIALICHWRILQESVCDIVSLE